MHVIIWSRSLRRAPHDATDVKRSLMYSARHVRKSRRADKYSQCRGWRKSDIALLVPDFKWFSLNVCGNLVSVLALYTALCIRCKMSHMCTARHDHKYLCANEYLHYRCLRKSNVPLFASYPLVILSDWVIRFKCVVLMWNLTFSSMFEFEFWRQTLSYWKWSLS